MLFMHAKKIFHYYPKMSLMFVALLVRIPLGYIFYGSCDIDAYAQIITHVLNNDLPSFQTWNYFPSISLYLWMVGFLASYTKLPLAFCIKLIPIICDAGICALLFDILKKTFPQKALAGSLLYALCPVSIIISSIHGQWESVFLFIMLLSFYVRDFYQDSYKKFFIFGFLFGLSILIKPLGLGFLFFFFVPYKSFAQEIGLWWKATYYTGIIAVIGAGISMAILDLTRSKLTDVLHIARAYHMTSICLSIVLFFVAVVIAVLMKKTYARLSIPMRQYLLFQVTSLVGLLIIMFTSFVVFTFLGFNIFSLIDSILRYANRGPQGFGLPFAFPFYLSPLSYLFKNRIFLMLGLGIIALFYYRQRIDIFRALCIGFAFVLGFAGLWTNYCVWIIPFAILGLFWQPLSLYVLFVSLFYLCFYSAPVIEDWSFLYRLTYAPLKSFSWLSPQQWMTSDIIAPWIHILGNYFIPASCWVFIFLSMFKQSLLSLPQTVKKQPLQVLRESYLVSITFFTLIVCFLMFLLRNIPLNDLFKQVVQLRYDAYAIKSIFGFLDPRSMIILHEASSPFFNIINLLLVGTVVWCWWAWKYGQKKNA